MLKTALFTLLCFFSSAYGYRCAGVCKCIAAEIMCNDLGLTSFPTLSVKLRIGRQLNVSGNDITKVDNIQVDGLKEVDIRRNPHLDCYGLPEVKGLKVISDCHPGTKSPLITTTAAPDHDENMWIIIIGSCTALLGTLLTIIYVSVARNRLVLMHGRETGACSDYDVLMPGVCCIACPYYAYSRCCVERV